MTVYLVGAGPGDPGLLTVRGAEVLRVADVVVHDRLADAALLELAPEDAERVDVGKSPGGPIHQDEINELLIREGRAGRAVVRLKGGDPYVFGRGGEEALALLRAGVPFEVVPGITSAIAVPAYAGVPVTHRGVATSFTVVTGHSRHAVDRETNWEALAAAGGTIVVLMGVAHRDVVAARLLRGGLAPDTPVLAVRWGTRLDQSSIRVRLDELGATPLEPPVTLVIGAVAGLELDWFERRPLFGRQVVVTRARAQASELSSRLRDLGAYPVEVPTIRIDPPADGGLALDRAAGCLAEGKYDWVVFSSANAVDALLERLPDLRPLGPVRIATMGPGTSRALALWHLSSDLEPVRSVSEGLLEVFPDPPQQPGRTVLLPRAAEGRRTLSDGLAAAGWTVDAVEAYRTVRIPLSEADRAAVAGADAICFASASAVTGFVESAGGSAVSGAASLPPVVVCIGPTTAAAARAAGVGVSAVASEHTLDGLVDALVIALASRPD
jgi:uroporphyrinogen III methyltransferase/synthase